MSAATAMRRRLLALGLLLLGGCGDGGPAGDGGTGADMAGTSGGQDMPAEMICGGASGKSCPMGMFCELAVGVCTDNVPGTCRAIPANCPTEMSPVCGCDDMTYQSDCLRRMASKSASQAGPCP